MLFFMNFWLFVKITKNNKIVIVVIINNYIDNLKIKLLYCTSGNFCGTIISQYKFRG